MSKLAKALLDTGMLETGLFQQGEQTIPFRFRLEMLPSYPDVLANIADALLPQIQALTIDRLVCPFEVVPVGTALSLKSSLPLVYSRGRGESPVYDLVGAYDVGHPAGLLLNVLDDAAGVQALMRGAKSVGLNIQHVITIIDTETVTLEHVSQGRLLTLTEIAETLQSDDLMSEGMVSAWLDWQRVQR